jgi:predicted cation transporter
MVASKWGWDTGFMMTHFGYKAAFAIIISTLTIALFFRKELNGEIRKLPENGMKFTPPLWITLIHIFSLAIVVLTAHHMVFFLGFFLFFLGFCVVTQEYQDEMKIKESLLVGFFLAGLVTLGVKQAWWLQPVLSQLGDLTLFFGAVSLTAITDNAALTYLGSLVELSEGAKYALVSGAVVGGGLTVIANAPNPAGYGILKGAFGSDGISPMGLLLSAIFPTAVAAACFLLLPSL